jgi:hypothetical protein
VSVGVGSFIPLVPVHAFLSQQVLIPRLS